MLSTKKIEFGAVLAGIYDFSEIGDEIAKHVHPEGEDHITVVCRGKVRVRSHDWMIEATAGQILDFKPGQPHAIMAIEDNTRIINIVKKVNVDAPAAE